MYSESFIVSEFSDRLSKTKLSSFDSILSLLGEYESICELRASEISYLSVDPAENSGMEEYEFIKGEEYLWSLIRELLALFIAESTITKTNVNNIGSEEPLNCNFQFLFWSAIQSWLQKLRRKTTTISTYEVANRSTDLSFSSLFQKSTEETSFQEAELLKTMFDAFRCGAFDDPSHSADEWNQLFDGYSNLWRQCSLNGASANESIRDTFRRFCQTFHSDSPYECLLYSIHTAETSTDLQQIEQLFDKVYDDSFGSYCTLEKHMDVVWSCVTCLLYQLSLKAQHLPHGNIHELEYYTRQKILTLTQFTSRSCQCIGLLLSDAYSDLFTLPPSAGLDPLRLHTSLQLVLSAIAVLTTATPFALDLTTTSYPPPFTSLHPLNYHPCLIQYLTVLEDRLDFQSICGYVQLLNTQERRAQLLQLHEHLYETLSQEPNRSILEEPIRETSCQSFFIQKLRHVVEALHSQTDSLVEEFVERSNRFLVHRVRQEEKDYLMVCRFLCYTIHFMEPKWKERVASAIIAILDECGISHPEFYLNIVKSIACESCLHPDYVNASDCFISDSLQFYHDLGEQFQSADQISSYNKHEEQIHQLETLFDNGVHVLSNKKDITDWIVSIVLTEWLHYVDHCIERSIDDEAKRAFYQLVMSKITLLSLPTCPIKPFINSTIAKELSNHLKEAMVGVLYKSCSL